MDLYIELASWIGWPAIVSFLVLLGGIGLFFYNSHMNLLKDNIQFLKDQIKLYEDYRPDIVAERLATNLRQTKEDLDALYKENIINQENLLQKELHLNNTLIEIENLQTNLNKAQEILQMVTESSLLCPNCGAPLDIKEIHYELVEMGKYSVEIDHEVIIYACGYELLDGDIQKECSKTNPNNKIHQKD